MHKFMSNSYTITETNTFTITHAKHIAAKVATDLLRFTRFYSKPTIQEINDYEAELIALLKCGYLDKVIYGFHRNGRWVEALQYHALPDGTLIGDDDPGKIRPRTDVPEESFSSQLWTTVRWHRLSPAEKETFHATVPIKRSTAPEMPLESGQWSSALNYTAGGRGLSRSTIIR